MITQVRGGKKSCAVFPETRPPRRTPVKYELFQRVALARDFPDRRLKKGDVATIVDRHPHPQEGEPGYSIEVFNAIGETIEVLVVTESEIQPLRADEVLRVRNFEQSASTG